MHTLNFLILLCPHQLLPGNEFQQWPLLLTPLKAFDHLTTKLRRRLTLNSWLTLTAKLPLAFDRTVILDPESYDFFWFHYSCFQPSCHNMLLIRIIFSTFLVYLTVFEVIKYKLAKAPEIVRCPYTSDVINISSDVWFKLYVKYTL
jgi:hypothetical protein